METYIKIFWVLHVKVEIYTIIIYTPEWNIFYYIYIYVYNTCIFCLNICMTRESSKTL